MNVNAERMERDKSAPSLPGGASWMLVVALGLALGGLARAAWALTLHVPGIVQALIFYEPHDPEAAKTWPLMAAILLLELVVLAGLVGLYYLSFRVARAGGLHIEFWRMWSIVVPFATFALLMILWP